ncbi:hypothetical protein LOTGIDRAFT_163194 [Lottia gigantea]|uniref:Uncharacterized protein n=1 Tax=Lottia gigantea TaxID=225164 RepID=V4A578_LOTGI|nr:hypothetical protein LOTGIDRAFT_163194 [Lottia gigantea]ESO91832.1 hypothetical protein LOTGIDRAFT_163194 [Lottia gigantea]
MANSSTSGPKSEMTIISGQNSKEINTEFDMSKALFDKPKRRKPASATVTSSGGKSRSPSRPSGKNKELLRASEKVEGQKTDILSATKPNRGSDSYSTEVQKDKSVVPSKDDNLTILREEMKSLHNDAFAELYKIVRIDRKSKQTFTTISTSG